MKRCSTCKAEKPESDFHRNSKSPDGLTNSCKDCAKARANRWYRENHKPHSKPSLPQGYLFCPKCKAIKPQDDFYAGQSYCKVCQKAYARKRYVTKFSKYYKRVMTDPQLMTYIEADHQDQINRDREQSGSPKSTKGLTNVERYEAEMEKLRLRPEDIPDEAPDLY